MSELHIPALSLVVLIGASGSGKSTSRRAISRRSRSSRVTSAEAW